MANQIQGQTLNNMLNGLFMKSQQEDLQPASSLGEVADHFKTYIQTLTDLYTLKAVDKSSSAFASLIVSGLVALLIILVLVLASIGGAFYLNRIIGNSFSGFFIVAALYILLAIVLYFSKNKWIRKLISNKIVSEMLED
jgi:hypothetical protein